MVNMAASVRLEPGGCTVFCSDSNSNMLIHPARGQVADNSWADGQTVSAAALDWNLFLDQVRRHQRDDAALSDLAASHLFGAAP